MMFNTWFPFMMEVGNKSIRVVTRFMDSKFSCSDQTTKVNSIQQYVNIHAGPKYYMHYKYSSIMNIVFITMMFGAGMPILFPIAAISLSGMFLLENFMLHYVYKQPPAYDEKLNNTVLNNLDKAPVFLLAFGYWVLTNLQLIENDYLEPMQKGSDYFISQHYWYDYINPLTAFNGSPAGSLLVMLYAYVGYLVLREPIEALWNSFFALCLDQGSNEDEWVIDEEIDLYQNCLDDDDKTFSLKEEDNCLKYGIRTMLK